MTKPHPLLIDLVAGRTLRSRVGEPVVQSALEHRVAGLLATAAENGPISPAAEVILQGVEASTWARNRAIAAAIAGIATVAASLDIDVAFIKGVTTETRWYRRMGERPTWDVDLVLAPWHLPRAVDFVAALQPTHSILPDLPTILKRDRIQSIDLGFAGIPVDLHLDPLKLEVARTRFPERLWENLHLIEIEGEEIPVFDPTVSLLLAALALNKDRFRYLVGYAVVTRIERDPQVDRARSEKLAKGEGLLGPYLATLGAVEIDLKQAHPHIYRPHPAWNRIWGPSVRLLGKEASIRYRYRQSFIPLFDFRRWPEVVASWLRRAFPTRALLKRLYPDQRGPYLVRIISSRLLRRLRRGRQRRQLKSAN
ncbi:MAG: nucleotidyltransferase family protein [Candidatus Binatia bacterium]